MNLYNSLQFEIKCLPTYLPTYQQSKVELQFDFAPQFCTILPTVDYIVTDVSKYINIIFSYILYDHISTPVRTSREHSIPGTGRKVIISKLSMRQSSTNEGESHWGV